MKSRVPSVLAAMFALLLLAALTPTTASAQACNFVTSGGTQYLTADCTTDATILIPDNMTLDCQGYTITAEDPAAGHFVGAVVQNAGTMAAVQNCTITADSLANACDTGANRLRGIMFEGASGFISNNSVLGINQGLSGCQEGNAIEVRNAPFDGTHPGTVLVDIGHNAVDRYQKTGVVANGDVDVTIHQNAIGSAQLEANIAANSVQLGFGAVGSVNNNQIVGNEWDGASDYAATAVLIYLAGDVTVSHNRILGLGFTDGGVATDIGVFAIDSGTVNVMNNRIFRDDEETGEKDDYGVGVWLFGNTGAGKIVRNRFKNWLHDFFGADVAHVNVQVSE